MNKLLLLMMMILVLTACGSDEAKSGTCQDEGQSLFIEYEEKGICINTNNISIDKYNDKVLGVAGISGNDAFIINRDGDYSDGSFSTEGKYYMNEYPYNLKILIWDLKYSSCEDSSRNGSRCKEYIAKSGEWDISSVNPFVASIKADKVLDQELNDETCEDNSCGRVRGRWSVQNR